MSAAAVLEQCITKTTHDILVSIARHCRVCDGGVSGGAGGGACCRDCQLVGATRHSIGGVEDNVEGKCVRSVAANVNFSCR